MRVGRSGVRCRWARRRDCGTDWKCCSEGGEPGEIKWMGLELRILIS